MKRTQDRAVLVKIHERFHARRGLQVKILQFDQNSLKTLGIREVDREEVIKIGT